MDPYAAIEQWLEAYFAGDREEMAYAADAYNSWISGGGFPATGRGYTVWGLSANWSEGSPASPVQLGDAPRNTFVTPHAIAEIIGG